MSAAALVLGLGVSGLAAARLLLGEGAAVTVVDSRAGEPFERRAAALRAAAARVELGAAAVPEGDFDIAVISPGLAIDGAWARALRARGIPVVAELELGARHCAAPLLAVTGTNGKSTLVQLLVDALTRAGRRAVCAGNFGTPLCEIALTGAAPDWIVVEVSSFQLEAVTTFRPRVGILLNLQPDHLDRHGDMARYRALKLRLFRRMAAGDTAIVHDALLAAYREAGTAGAAVGGGRGPDVVTFGLSDAADVRYSAGRVYRSGGDPAASVSLAGTMFDNPVLGQAAAAALAALTACGVEGSALTGAADAFERLPHRMVDLGAVRGVRFIDDSKATNLAALEAALTMLPGRVRLIVGGQLKEHELKSLEEILVKRVSAVYGIGESARRIVSAWGACVPATVCGTLAKAVEAAWREAAAGDTILLSPGCASFDQFRGFDDRGNQFAKLVGQLGEES